MALGLAAVALGPAGCSDTDHGAEIRAAIAGFQASFRDGDLGRACDGMTPAARRHVGQAGHDPPRRCPVDLRAVRDMVGSRPPVVTRVEVEGDRAVATMRLGGDRLRVPLERQGSAWRIDGVYGGRPAARQEDKF